MKTGLIHRYSCNESYNLPIMSYTYSAYLAKQNQPRPDCVVKRLWCYKGTDKKDNFDFDWRNEWPRVRLNSESPVFVSERDVNSASLGDLSDEVNWVDRFRGWKWFLAVRQIENVDSIVIDNLVLQSDPTDFPKWTNPFPVAASLIHWKSIDSKSLVRLLLRLTCVIFRIQSHSLWYLKWDW